jgi:hypothetical protein
MPYGVGLKDERPTSNHAWAWSLRSAISFDLFTISVSFQPFDSPQGRKPVENPELVEVVERPF